MTENDTAVTNTKALNYSQQHNRHSFYSISKRELDEEKEKTKEDYDTRIRTRCQAYDKDFDAALEATKIMPLEGADDKLVTWEGKDDQQKPTKLVNVEKVAYRHLYRPDDILLLLCSSIFSTTMFATAPKRDVPVKVMILGLSLYVVGFTIGGF